MKYDAFISYRHATLDMEIAKKIHSGLEGFRIPASIQKKCGKKKITRVFRDQEELPIGSDLNDNISSALSESEFLIVICSPRTPDSYWVCKEIETFIKMHDRQHVLAVLVEGEPDESFPKQLLVDENGESVEPLAADVRGETSKERKAKLKTELLRLAAPLIGCNYDDLKQRHRERMMKRTFGFAFGFSSLAAVLGVGFALYNANMAAKIEKNYKLAMENQYKYMADMAQNLFTQGYREDAILLAMEALADQKNDMPYVPQAECVLSDALYTYAADDVVEKDGMLEHDVPVGQISFDADRCHLLTVDQNEKLYVWDVKNGNELITTITQLEKNAGKNATILKCNHVGDEIILCTNIGVSGYSLEGELLWETEVADCNSASIHITDHLALLQSSSFVTAVDLNTHHILNTYSVPEDGVIFSSTMQYDEETKNLFVAYVTDEADSKIMAINVENNTQNIYPVRQDYLAEIAYSEDGSIYALSYSYDDIVKNPLQPYTAYIQKINLESGEEQWCYTTEFSESGIATSASAIMKYRSYVDEEEATGELHKELILASNTKIISINANTGEELSKLSMSGAVRSILLSKAGPLGYAAISTGRIEIVDFSTGKILSDFMMETDLEITDLMVADGIFAVKAYASPDVLIMKYHTGKNMQHIFTAEDSVGGVTESPDGKWLVAQSGYFDEMVLYFIKKSDLEKEEIDVRSYDLMAEGYGGVECYCFTSDNQLFICTIEGKAFLLNPENLERKEIALEEAEKISDCYVNASRKYAVVHNNNQALVINLTKGKQIAQFTNDIAIKDSIITEDGNKIYLVDQNGTVKVGDLSSNTIETLSEELDKLCKVNIDNILAVSPDGQKLAMICRDGMARVYDTNSNQICFEVEYIGYLNPGIFFTKESSKLVLQGDDYYINMYDTSSWQCIYTSKKQYDGIVQIIDLENQNRLAIVVKNGIIVLETENYIPVAEINEGRLLTTDAKIIKSHYREVVAFPFQTIKSLKENAKEQL